MARNPTRFSPILNAQASAKRVRDAFDAAKSRTGGEGRLVAFSAGGFFLAFVLLAGLAPFLMRAPAIVASLAGFFLVALVLVATGLGALALWRIVRAGVSREEQSAQIYSAIAVEVALSDAEDAGLRAYGPRMVHDAMTGRVAGYNVAVMSDAGVTYAVIRLRAKASTHLLLSPDGVPWPFPIEKPEALTPISLPKNIVASAWAHNRDAGIKLANTLAPALAMSAAGGEVPFLSIRERALVLMWTRGDVGTAAVIAGEIIKGLAQPPP